MWCNSSVSSGSSCSRSTQSPPIWGVRLHRQCGHSRFVVRWSSQVKDVRRELSHPDCGQYPSQQVETCGRVGQSGRLRLTRTFPSELLEHHLWWNGPAWLTQSSSQWPQSPPSSLFDNCEEEKEVCLVSPSQPDKVIDVCRYSSYNCLKCLKVWIFRFTHKCNSGCSRPSGSLATAELGKAEQHLWWQAQPEHFFSELCALGRYLSKGSCLRIMHPIIDQLRILRVCDCVYNSDFAYSQHHPVILYCQQPLSRLIIRAEHIYLLHTGSTLISSTLSRHFHILDNKKLFALSLNPVSPVDM